MPEWSAKDIALYVATHNQPIESGKSYIVPIQTGAALTEEVFCELTDDTGIHISDKNREFCELTALYWIWKNSPKSIVGLAHYRRRFLINPAQICGILERYDVIVPPKYYFRMSIRKEYSQFHVGKDLDVLIYILDELRPEIVPFFNKVLDGNMLIPYNMVIAKKEIIDDYCHWLFPVLFELEKRLDFSKRDQYQRRVMGFLSERLFTAFVQLKNYTVYTCPVTIPETKSVCRHMKYKIGKQFNKIYFQLTK